MFRPGVLALAVMAAFAQADDTAPVYIPVSDAPPPGFEAVAQTLLLNDIYLNGRRIATTTLGESTDRLPEALPDAVLKALVSHRDSNGEIYRDTSYVVTRNAQDNRIDVYQRQEGPDMIQLGGSGALRTSLNGIHQQFGDSTRTTMVMNNRYSRGDNGATVSIQQLDSDTRVLSAYYTHDNDDTRYLAGLIPQTDVAAGSSNNIVAGVGVDFNRGSTTERKPLNILLTAPANVVLTYAGQLLESVTLQEGSHSIDTSTFPAGNYPVTATIHYLDGRTETRTLSSGQQRISSAQNWSVLGAIAGVQGDTSWGPQLPDEYTPFVGLSLSGYNTDSFTSTAQLSYDDDRFTFSPSMRYDAGRFYASFQGRFTTDDYWQFAQRFNVDHGNAQTYLDYFALGADEFKTRTVTLTHQHQVSSGNLYGSVYYNSSLRHRTSYQLMYSTAFNIGSLDNLMLTTSVNFGDEVVWGLRLTYGEKFDSLNMRYRLSSYLDNQRNDAQQHTLDHSYRYASGLVQSKLHGMLTSYDNNSYFAQSNINDSRYGQYGAQISMIEGVDNPYVTTSVRTSALIDRTGVTFTGTKPVSTGLIIDLSDAPSGDYKLTVNRQRHRLAGGRRHIIPLPPDADYRVALSSSNSKGVAVLGGTQHIHLRQGDVFRPDWQISPVTYVVGRVTVDGKPVSNTLVKTGVAEAYTDERGFIAVEALVGEGVIRAGDVTCTLLSVNNLLTIGEHTCKFTNHVSQAQ